MTHCLTQQILLIITILSTFKPNLNNQLQDKQSFGIHSIKSSKIVLFLFSQRSPRTGGRLHLSHPLRRAYRHRQMERGRPQKAGRTEFPQSVPGGRTGA